MFAYSLRVGWLACAGALLVVALYAPLPTARAQVLDKDAELRRQTFWDNRDFEWYREQIPFFACPDANLETTYYYRWELLTKHLTYGAPNTGYLFTEFIDRPFWSGAYGAISCPAGHQLYESRWLRSPRIARDYARYWFRTSGAQPRNYSTWLADSVWELHQVHPDADYTVDLLPDLVKNFAGWEGRHWVADVGLFWQTGHDDGMEFNINSRQTQDILRGAPSYRPSFNAYMWADARAIERIATLAGDRDTADRFRARAAQLKGTLQRKLWDADRQFFFPMLKNDEERDGHRQRAGSLTYQTGRYAGSPHGRELIGYVPWQFNLPDAGRGYEQAWRFLMDRDYFAAPFGPTTVEQRDPQYLLQKSCCWWSGQSWPYATSQTLKALANLLQHYEQSVVSKDDYWKLLDTFSRSHRKEGRPYLAEALHPETGSFEGHDGYNHSEHYFHSSFCDLVITGLVGLQPRADERLDLRPLIPDAWDYFALDEIAYRGRRISVAWDRTGERFGRGAGFRIYCDGKVIAERKQVEWLTVDLPPREAATAPAPAPEKTKTSVNFAVNNDGDYYPRVTASHVGPGTSVAKLVDGNFWYHVHPPNRWTSAGSPNERDWIIVDLGTPRRVQTLKLYILDDGQGIVAPRSIELETWRDGQWTPLAAPPEPPRIAGHRPTTYRLPSQPIERLRVTLVHAPNARSGLTEIELWGEAELPVAAAPPPAGNLAYNSGKQPLPRVSASHTSRFDRVEMANDGKVAFLPTPHNRWTSYESPNESDWLELDFGEPKKFGRVELAIYDDRGGVQAPSDYRVEWWDGKAWRSVEGAKRTPERPTGGVLNELRFPPVTASKVRVVFTHAGRARSGVSEIFVWNE